MITRTPIAVEVDRSHRDFDIARTNNGRYVFGTKTLLEYASKPFSDLSWALRVSDDGTKVNCTVQSNQAVRFLSKTPNADG